MRRDFGFRRRYYGVRTLLLHIILLTPSYINVSTLSARESNTYIAQDPFQLRSL